MAETRDERVAEVATHLKTYHGFIILMRYVVLAHLVAGVFVLTTFFSGGGWFFGILATAVMLAVGLYFAKDRKRMTRASEIATLLVSTAADEDPPEVRYLREAAARETAR